MPAVLPGLLAVTAPLVIGFLMGPQALGGFLAGATATGVLLAAIALCKQSTGIVLTAATFSLGNVIWRPDSGALVLMILDRKSGV